MKHKNERTKTIGYVIIFTSLLFLLGKIGESDYNMMIDHGVEGTDIELFVSCCLGILMAGIGYFITIKSNTN